MTFDENNHKLYFGESIGRSIKSFLNNIFYWIVIKGFIGSICTIYFVGRGVKVGWTDPKMKLKNRIKF